MEYRHRRSIRFCCVREKSISNKERPQIRHAERKGNPALVSDLVEEFRTVIDSLVLYTLNRGLLQERDFYYRKDQPGCFLSNEARKKYLGIFESRMWQESRDGYTGQTLNFRRQIEKQVMILRDVIAGTRTQYDPYKVTW